MDPESEDGNIEYKLKLLDVSSNRIEKLASQMRYRCNEGNSECFYNLGVEDDGSMTGINEHEYELTIRCLREAAELNLYHISQLSRTHIKDDLYVYELHIREVNDVRKYIDLKVTIAGSVDCGKSTFLSVLINGKADNGRGRARLSVFNFPHEVESGRTSSISHHILGFDNNGNVTNYRDQRVIAWPDIVKRSSKIVTFFDLAGHEKYLKTTIFGLTNARPDLCVIMVGANRGILKMTLEHVFLCKTLCIPFAIVITKLDLTKDKQQVLQKTLDELHALLKKPGIRLIPMRIKSEEDIIRCAMHIHSESIVPIFLVSNVTLEGIAHVHKFMNLLPPRPNSCDHESQVECYTDIAWLVTGVGTVVGGHLVQGRIHVGDKLWFGPNQNKYVQVVVRSIHCKKVSIQQAQAPSYVCLALRGIHKTDFKRGNVILGTTKQHVLCSSFKADIDVLKTHSTTIKLGYQPILHVQNIRTSVTIKDIQKKICARASSTNDQILRTGDSAEVILEFVFEHKFVKVGSQILLCEGRTKVTGIITEIFCASKY
jgi:GTPase